MQSHDLQKEENECILLVDDNPTNLLVLEEIISQNLAGCCVLTAGSGREAIRLARGNPVDAAFIDMQMPGMDGLETCRRLKNDPETTHIPVVLITSHQSTAELRARGIDAGAQDFISRPIRNVEMLARINAVLRVKSFEDRLRAENSSLKAAIGEMNRAHRWLAGLFTAAQLELPTNFPALVLPEGGVTLEYFQKEIYEQLPPALKRTMLKLSLPDEIPLFLAEMLSEIDNIRDVLEYLERQEFYIRAVEKRPLIFQMEPDLKRFLKACAFSELSLADRREAFRCSADWFLERELPEKALCALLEGEDFARAEEIANQFALSLFIQNRLGPCLVDALPADRYLESTFPWLIFLRALILFDTDPDAFRIAMERAHDIFLEQQRKDGEFATGLLRILCHSLLGIRSGSEPFLLRRMEGLCEEFHSRISLDLQTFAASCCALGRFFILGDPEGAEKHLFSDGCVPSPSSTTLSVVHYTLRGYLAYYSGRWGRARQNLEHAFTAKPSALPVFADAFRSMFEADFLRGCGVAFPGKEYFDTDESSPSKLYVAITDPYRLLWRIGSELANGCYDSAHEFLRLEEHASTIQGVHRKRLFDYKVLVLSLQGDEVATLYDCEEAFAEEDPLFSAERAIIRSLVLAEAGKKKAAREMLNRAVGFAETPLNAHLLPSALLQRSFVRLKNGEKRVNKDLCEGLSLLKEHCLDGFVAMTPQALDMLLSRAFFEGLEKDFVEHMALHSLDKAFGEDGERVPVLTMRVLGGFVLEHNNRLVADRRDLGGVQRDFLELFLRNFQMQIGQEEAQGLLWPESDQRKGRSNLDSLLLRFRKIPLKEIPDYSLRDYIDLRKGILSIRYCWVDILHFLESLQNGLKHARKKERWHADFYFRKAYSLWIESRDATGESFNRYNYPEVLQLFLDGILCWADLLNSREKPEIALQVCEEGNRADPTNDEITRYLYGNYMHMKNAGKAARLLESYRKALKKEEYSDEEVDEILQDIRTSASVCY